MPCVMFLRRRPPVDQFFNSILLWDIIILLFLVNIQCPALLR